jgi:hypothetical protein
LNMVKNYPEIMIPMYRENRFVSLFFIIFLIINNIVIFKFVIGIIKINYKYILSQQTKHVVSKFKR